MTDSDNPDVPDPADPDEVLLADLRRIASVVDPLPDSLVHAGRESLTWRRVDAELAALLSDSSVDDHRLALVRSTGSARAVAFEAGDFTIELDILGSGAQRTLVGQLVPPRPAMIEVQTTESRTTVEADEHGRFRVEGVPVGRMRLRVTGREPMDAAAETTWITI